MFCLFFTLLDFTLLGCVDVSVLKPDRVRLYKWREAWLQFPPGATGGSGDKRKSCTVEDTEGNPSYNGYISTFFLHFILI